MLVLHIVVALASLLSTALAFVMPSKTKLHISYVVVALTLVTGTYVVLSMHASMVRSCFTGLIYLAVVSAGLSAVWRKTTDKS
jgi:hypothetical protein